MTCRGSETPGENTEGNTFETSCYKCGRPMLFVKATMKRNGKETWINDDQWSQDEFFEEHLDVSRTFEVSDEIRERILQFVEDEVSPYYEKMKHSGGEDDE